MSTKPKSSLIFLALLPPEEIREDIKKLKLHFAEQYNSKRALRLPAHITLVPPFRLAEEKSETLFRELDHFSEDFLPLKIVLNGFGAFPPRVIFIEVYNSEELKPFRDWLFRLLENFLPSEDLKTGRAFRPHITLATRDLSSQNFDLAWNEFRNRKFEAHFSVSSLSLFRHNGKTWDQKRDFKFKKPEI